jgi:hypothetical protein
MGTKTCVDAARKNFALPQFSGITSKDIKAIDSELKKLFGVNGIKKIPKTFETLLKIFDRISQVKYKSLSIDVRSPAQVLQKGEGDCDDKAVSLALMLNRIFPNSTRIVILEIFTKKKKWVKHAYLQFDLIHIPELKDVITSNKDGVKNMIEFASKKITRRYKVSRKYASFLLKAGIESTNRGLIGNTKELRQAPSRVWLGLDATTKLPGWAKNKLENTRLLLIQYPRAERLTSCKEHEKDLERLEKMERELNK